MLDDRRHVCGAGNFCRRVCEGRPELVEHDRPAGVRAAVAKAESK